ncbi:MAG: hypothetical protein V1694_07805 [Candidatus Eisenbacteria bacterium]
MPRLPLYCRIIDRYKDLVDAHQTEAHGNRPSWRLRANLLRQLLATLMTGKTPHDNLPDRKLISTLKKLRQRLRHDEYRLCKAWYENRIYGTSKRTLLASWQLHPLEIKYLEQLWSDLRYTRDEYRKLLTDTEATWQFEVDERHEEVVIWLDDRAIGDIVLVGLESYAVPKGRGLKSTETYGICFGSTKSTEERRQAHGKHTIRHIHIDSVHIQLRAEGYSNKVTYDLRSLDTQMEAVKHLFPQLDIVGDFHTHPYHDVKELRGLKGWHYSRADEANIPEWVCPLREMGYQPRTSLVVAIAKGGKRAARPTRVKPNTIRFSVGKHHFYLACFRIIGNRYSEKHITLNSSALPAI